MRLERIQSSFESWRDAARVLVAEHVQPVEVVWTDDRATDVPALLPESFKEPNARRGRFSDPAGDIYALDRPEVGETTPPRVPKAFIDLAKLVACHRDPLRWTLLYRILFRLTHGQPLLMRDMLDDDVLELVQRHKAVRRDRHKMTAFVRFRRLETPTGDLYHAWHRPDHYIVRLVAPFFVDRFKSMRFSILTPNDSLHWDGQKMTFTEGVAVDPLKGGDDIEKLWTTYYANIFNPARIKLNAMRAEMPKKHWPTLPETALIPQMLRDAPQRVQKMIDYAPKEDAMITATSAEPFIPETKSLTVLRKAANGCEGCPLYKPATQVVFGKGPDDARVVFVGEQPGDQEDLAGLPFVGPAGQLMDEVLEEVGIDRSLVYVTNAVKHFKFEQRGKRRIHAKPSAREMAACKPWLTRELGIIRPQVLVLLGATAAQTLVGRQFRVTQSRGQWFESDYSKQTIATIHPSAILRSIDEAARIANRQSFADDLRLVAKAIKAA